MKNDLDRKIFWGCSLCILVLAFAYIFFISSSVFHVVLAKEIRSDIDEAHIRVGNSEAHFLALSHKIDDTLAERLGFISLTPNDKKFVARDATVGLSRSE